MRNNLNKLENKPISKISLFLMTFKGLKTLEYIIERDYLQFIERVIIGKDKNVENDYADDLSKLCAENSINWNFKDDEFHISSKYILTVSWRWLIKNTDSRIIVFHESLLPKYRGFAPLVNQLINEEGIIGMSCLFGEKEYDTGDIICQFQKKIDYPIKIQAAIEIISSLYLDAIDFIFDQISKTGEINSDHRQDNNLASFSIWRDNSDYFIDWNKSSNYIKRFVDAVGFPYKGAATKIEGRIIRIVNVEIVPDLDIEIRDVGKVIYIEHERPVVICGEGLIKILDAKYDDNNESIFPQKKFRIRFTTQ